MLIADIIFSFLLILLITHVGSIKEAEEFDTLSPEESKKRLAVLVTKMDLNGESAKRSVPGIVCRFYVSFICLLC